VSQLGYYTQRMVEELRDSASRHVDWYYKPDGTEFPGKIPSDARRDTPLAWRELGPLLTVNTHRPYESDAVNAMIVYETLRDLTPQQGADERLWVHLSHGDCADYTAQRWLASRPDNPDTAVRRVLSHFFARDSRALIRDHGVSRLWWLGAIAHDVHPDDPRLFLEIVLDRQDVTWELFGRPSVSMNRQVLKSILSVMRSHWDDCRLLFKREVFRAWMVNLNRRGGVVLLDSLHAKPLLQLLLAEADSALEAENA